MTETKFYEPARLSTPPKPLFSLKPLDLNQVSNRITDCKQTAILGQARAQKLAWLLSINIRFNTIEARWFVLHTKWFLRRLIPALDDVEAIEKR